MNILCVATIAVLLTYATAIAAPVPAGRDAALTKLLSLREQKRPAQLASEYGSIEDAFRQGENKLAAGAGGDAEICFKLMLLKAALFEQRRDALREQARTTQATAIPEPVKKSPAEEQIPQTALPERLTAVRGKAPVRLRAAVASCTGKGGPGKSGSCRRRRIGIHRHKGRQLAPRQRETGGERPLPRQKE